MTLAHFALLVTSSEKLTHRTAVPAVFRGSWLHIAFKFSTPSTSKGEWREAIARRIARGHPRSSSWRRVGARENRAKLRSALALE